MQSPSLSFRSSAAFTLLEVLLAISIFTLAAVGLLQALNIIGLATIEASQQHRVDRQLKSLLNEYALDPNLRPGVTERDDLDSDILYQIKVSPSELTNEDGRQLDFLFTVEVNAFTRRSSARGDTGIASVERIVHRQLWRPATIPLQ